MRVRDDGAVRRGQDGLRDPTRPDQRVVLANVFTQHVVGGRDVHAVTELLIGRAVCLALEGEPVWEALEASRLARRQPATAATDDGSLCDRDKRWKIRGPLSANAGGTQVHDRVPQTG